MFTSCCLGAAALQVGIALPRAPMARVASPVMDAETVVDKKHERRRIMGEDRYKRGAPALQLSRVAGDGNRGPARR